LCADDTSTATNDPSGTKTDEQQTLIATLFDKPLYLKQVTPADVELKRKQLAPGEFNEWLLSYRGRRMYRHAWRAASQRYVQQHQITVSEEELAAITRFVERRLKSTQDMPTDTTFTPEQRKSAMVGWGRGVLMDWKVCKSLHEEYGGRVGIGSLGAWTAFDGQNALLRQHIDAAEIKFHHPEIEAAFWQHTKIKNFSDAYPKGERLKQLLATPPYLQN
jgi:hypothetical protein